MSQKDWENFPALRAQLIHLKEIVSQLLSKIGGDSHENLEDLINLPINPAEKSFSDRTLENGGLAPLRLKEFTDAFTKLDDIHDYNGVFLVNLGIYILIYTIN